LEENSRFRKLAFTLTLEFKRLASSVTLEFGRFVSFIILELRKFAIFITVELEKCLTEQKIVNNCKIKPILLTSNN